MKIKNWREAGGRYSNQDYWRQAHGEATFKQYKILRKYIYQKTGKYYNLTQLCVCDFLDNDFDVANAKLLKNYLKKHENEWYNRYNERYWGYDNTLKNLINIIREEHDVL